MIILEELLVEGPEKIPSAGSVQGRARGSRTDSGSLAAGKAESSGSTTLMWTQRNCSDKYLENSPERGRA